MPSSGVRPLTRSQALENEAFLRALRRTGNVREAARAVGAHRAKFTRRRARHPAFAAAWDAALAIADAALVRQESGTARAEPRVTRTASGRLQLRRAQPGRLDRAAEQRFLAALSATANIRLSAAAAGFRHGAFYQRRRGDAGFAREWRLALAQGYDQLEQALIAGTLPDAFRDDAWQHNDPPAIPPMTANQALQLLYLHQKEARLGGTAEALKTRRGKSRAARDERLTIMGEHRREREREAFDVAEAARLARGEPTIADFLIGPLPDLAQVTGWSNATGEPAWDEARALFG